LLNLLGSQDNGSALSGLEYGCHLIEFV